MFKIQLLLVASCLIYAPQILAQDAKAKLDLKENDVQNVDFRYSKPPKLLPVFADDFSKDTHGQYDLHGKADSVQWEKNALNISDGGEIKRKLQSGPWVKLDLDLSSKNTAIEKVESEFDISLIVKGKSDCTIRVKRVYEKEKCELTVSILMTVLTKDGKLKEVVVREFKKPGQPIDGKWQIEYRYGLLLVTTPKRVLHCAHSFNGQANIDGFAFKSRGKPILIQRLAVAATPQHASLKDSDEQSLSQIDKAFNRALNRFDNDDSGNRSDQSIIEAIKDYEVFFGKYHPDFARVLNYVAEFYERRGHLEKAKQLYEKVSFIRKTVLGDLHPDYSVSLNNLALVFKKKGRLEEAETAYKGSLKISEQTLGKEDPDYYQSLRNLISLYMSSDKLDAAKPLCVEATQLSKVIYGEHHLEHVSSLIEMGRVMHSGENPDKTKRISERARNIINSKERQQTVFFGTLLNDLGELFRLLNAAEEATVSFSRSRQVYLETLGPMHPYYLMVTEKLAEEHLKPGQFKKAEDLYQELVEKCSRIYGKNHPKYERFLTQLAITFEAQDKFESSLPLRQEILSRTANDKVENVEEYVARTNSLGYVHHRLGDFDKRDVLLLECKSFLESQVGINDQLYRDHLIHMINVFNSSAEYIRAIQAAKEYCEIEKKAAPRSNDHIMSMVLLSSLYKQVGEYETAKSIALDAKQFAENNPNIPPQNQAAILVNLSRILQAMGAYEEVEAVAIAAKKIFEDNHLQEHPSYGATISDLANLHRKLKQYEKAEVLTLQSIEVASKTQGKRSLAYANALNELLVLYTDTGEIEKLDQYIEEIYGSIETRKRILGEKHPLYAQSLSNVANLIQHHDVKLAEKLFLEAIEVNHQIYGQLHFSNAILKGSLAGLYGDSGQFEKADALFKEASQIMEAAVGTVNPLYEQVLFNQASFYEAFGKDAEAIELLSRACEINLVLAERYAAIQTEKMQREYARKHRDARDALISILLRTRSQIQTCYQQVLASKGSTLIRQKRYRELSGNKEIGPLFKELQSTATQIDHVSRSYASNKTHEQQLLSLRAKQEEIEKKIAKLSGNPNQDRVSVSSLAESIPDEFALVDIVRISYSEKRKKRTGDFNFEDRYVAFVLRDGSVAHMEDLGPAEKIDSYIDTWRSSLGASPLSAEAGRALRRLVWEPLERQFNGKAKVLISPDGMIAKLPFAALPGKTENRYLIENYQIAILPVPRLLKKTIESRDRASESLPSLLAVGNVSYGESASYPMLPETEGEVERIAELFQQFTGAKKTNGTKILLGPLATESRFKHEAPKHSYMHLATHGFFADAQSRNVLVNQEISFERERGDQSIARISGTDSGLSSGLVFANANATSLNLSTEDNGIVTAQDIAFLPMSEVKLAVLSACETGLGKVTNGEGMIGLQRSFQIAGARSVVSSLWSVDSWATRLLMERFYHNLWVKKMATREALREAQLWMLQNPKELTAKMNESGIRGIDKVKGREINEDAARTPPFYWAAWTLSGDWE